MDQVAGANYLFDFHRLHLLLDRVHGDWIVDSVGDAAADKAHNNTNEPAFSCALSAFRKAPHRTHAARLLPCNTHAYATPQAFMNLQYWPTL
ncbi:unnamed protein product [Toxocara canis]|uniref:Uncharacterized protein n=1 Tax=Toxocara canis TaxID=6265 RepID=A0A183UJQ4_TOXCA|nr:unnamed protein product [Toxocara canis]